MRKFLSIFLFLNLTINLLGILVIVFASSTINFYANFIFFSGFVSVVLALYLTYKEYYYLTRFYWILIFYGLCFLLNLTFNKFYWGYFIEKPAIFSELCNATNCNLIGEVQNINLDVERLTASKLDLLSKINDDEINLNRPIKLLNYKENYKLDTALVGKYRLLNIYLRYKKNGFGKGYLIDFNTKKNRYVFINYNTGEIKNDHHIYVEQLFKFNEEKIIPEKTQMFFYDVAGIEGLTFKLLNICLSIFIGILLIVNIVGFFMYNFFNEK